MTEEVDGHRRLAGLGKPACAEPPGGPLVGCPIDPERCLVFEDSIPGLMAAKNAGMQTIAIPHRTTDLQQATEIADGTIQDYTELPPDFFRSITKVR